MMKKPSAAASASAAARLLVSRSRSRRATDESIEFFSALRDCEFDPPPVQTGRRLADDGLPGKVRRSGDGDGGGELMLADIGKHDYDWLLTPPATPRRSPATSGEATGSAAALNRLARATSASYAKNNSPVCHTRRRNGIHPSTSRLARSSSAATAAPSRGLSHVRTLSSASSSVVGGATNGSGRSTPLGSAVTTPRTPPAHAREVSSAAASGSTATRQRKAPLSSSGISPASARRPRATTIPRSTTVVASSSQQAEEELTTIRGGNAVPRSRLAGSTAQSIKARGPLSAPGAKQCYGNAMASTASQRRGSSMSMSMSPSPAVAAAGRESAPRGELLAKRLSMNGDGPRINVEKVTPTGRTAVPSGLTRTASRKPANTDAKRTGKENVDDGRKCKVDVRHGGAAPAPYLKPTVHHRSIRATASRSSRPVSMATTYDGGSGTSEKKGKPAAAAAVL